MLQKLMGSKTRVKILTLFIINPKREYYAREIERELKSNFEAIRTELINLEKIGLLRSRISGKQRYYSINTGHVLFPEFKSMILKTVLERQFINLVLYLLLGIMNQASSNIGEGGHWPR